MTGVGAHLGCYEDLGNKSPGRCTCGPVHLRLRSEGGELVPARGRSVNRCAHCAALAAFENLDMLLTDVLEGGAPRLLVVLGTRTATLDMGAFREGRRRFTQAMRRRFPGFEYAYQVEFTTGYGDRSGGERRPHWNWLIKGAGAGDVDAVREVVCSSWCVHVDAEPHAQYVGELATPTWAIKYIAGHFAKASQRPPAGFEGHRFRVSRGYFPDGVAVQRARARQAQAYKRAVWVAERAGLSPEAARHAAEVRLRRQAQTRWVLASESGGRLSPEPVGGELWERLRLLGTEIADFAATLSASGV